MLASTSDGTRLGIEDFRRDFPLCKFGAELVPEECAAGVTFDAKVVGLFYPFHEFDVFVKHVIIACEALVVNDRIYPPSKRCKQPVDRVADGPKVGYVANAQPRV